MRNCTIEHNMAVFSELSLAARWRGKTKQRLVL